MLEGKNGNSDSHHSRALRCDLLSAEKYQIIRWYYEQATDQPNLAAFVRSLVGLSQEAVNEKFGAFLNGNTLNSQQQEFVRTIINYVRENDDVETADLVNTEPFNNYDIAELIGAYLAQVVAVVNVLHNSILAGAA